MNPDSELELLDHALNSLIDILIDSGTISEDQKNELLREALQIVLVNEESGTEDDLPK